MKLLESVKRLKNGKIETLVNARLMEFGELGRKAPEELFQELCFCLLTANYSAEGGIRIQKELGRGFCYLPEKELSKHLKGLGHRYPNARAGYIKEARRHMGSLKGMPREDQNAREWLVKNIKGLGMKEASHFLRNIGFLDLAIIDFHIVDLLVKHGLIKKPKTLTRKRYVEIEKVLRELAGKLNMNLAELDLYLWYLETGKILK